VEESSDKEHDQDQDQEQSQKFIREVALLAKKYGRLLGKKGYEARSSFSNKSKFGKSKRYCYRCGDPNHFIADCPKKETNKEKEESKYKTKPLYNRGKQYKEDPKARA
jgi:hypothetical protein